MTADRGFRSGQEQRAVPVGVETIAIVDGMGIRRLHPVQPHQRRDQHEQILMIAKFL